MQVHSDPLRLPSFRRAVITIGTFDGVHLGHRLIIGRMLERASEVGGETVIITFDPHPRSVLHPDAEPVRLLTSPAERTRQLEGLGIDHLVVIPFTKAFADMEAGDYISDFLVRLFHPDTIIIGYDHRFGRGRRGDYRMLEDHAPRYGYTVRELDAELLREAAVSSTRIRAALAAGDASLANELLGRPYSFSGTVVSGDRRGRTIGYPTANLSVDDSGKLMPADGVYAVRAGIDGDSYLGMMNIGTRPTVDGARHATEVHLFDFDEDIYGRRMEVYVMARIRGERRFPGLEGLRQQLSEDRRMALSLLGAV
jgi:riboflavin kinase/FMN adenylyltransferase